MKKVSTLYRVSKFLFVIFCVAGVYLHAQQVFEVDSLVLKEVKVHMSVLAHDSLRGREGGTVYEQKAAFYLISRLKEIGIPPLPGTDDYLQHFVLDSAKKLISANVLAFLDNQAPYTVVLGAHYDHLGFELHNNSMIIYNGADDNASGTTMVLTLAKSIKKEGLKNYNYLFAFWGSEEKGLLGSSHFCASEIYSFSKIACYINFDMVGSLDWDNSKSLVVFGLGSSTFWDSLGIDTVWFGNKKSFC